MAGWFSSITSAVLDKLNEAAKLISSDNQADQVAQPCPLKKWKLKIQVVSVEPGRWPAEMFGVGLNADGNVDPSGNLLMNAQSSPELEFSGNGHRMGQPGAWLQTWDLVDRSEHVVTLDDGDDKFVIIKIKPKPWIAFHVLDHKTGSAIPNVKLTVDTPGQPQKERTSAAQKILVEALEPGASCKIEKLVHPEDDWVWYVEDFASQ